MMVENTDKMNHSFNDWIVRLHKMLNWNTSFTEPYKNDDNY